MALERQQELRSLLLRLSLTAIILAVLGYALSLSSTVTICVLQEYLAFVPVVFWVPTSVLVTVCGCSLMVHSADTNLPEPALKTTRNVSIAALVFSSVGLLASAWLGMGYAVAIMYMDANGDYRTEEEVWSGMRPYAYIVDCLVVYYSCAAVAYFIATLTVCSMLIKHIRALLAINTAAAMTSELMMGVVDGEERVDGGVRTSAELQAPRHDYV